MVISFFDLPYGADNPVSRPYISKRYDHGQTSMLRSLQRTVSDEYMADTFDGCERRFKAYALRVDTKEQEFGKEGVYIKVRAWCPETHPGHKAFQPEGFDDHVNIDKFPQYRALTDAAPAPNPGEEIWVQYLNVENLEGLRYIEPVKAREHLVNLIKSVTPAGAFNGYPCGALSSNAMPSGDTSGTTTTFPGGNVKLNKVVIIGTSMVGGDADARGNMGKALNNLLKEMGAGQIVQIGVGGSVLKHWVTGKFAKKKTKANSSGLSLAKMAAEKPNVFFVAIGGNDRFTPRDKFLDYARQVMNTLSPDKSIPIVWTGHTHGYAGANPEKIRPLYKALADTLPGEYPNLLAVFPDTPELAKIYMACGTDKHCWHPGLGVHGKFLNAVRGKITTFLGIGQGTAKSTASPPVLPGMPAGAPSTSPPPQPPPQPPCNTVGQQGVPGIDLAANEISQYGPFGFITTTGWVGECRGMKGCPGSKGPPGAPAMRYQLTDVDVMWAARMAMFETGTDLGDTNLVLWSMTNLFALQGNHFGSATKFKTFSSLCLAFSQPINPKWSRSGNACRCIVQGNCTEKQMKSDLPSLCTEARFARRDAHRLAKFSDMKVKSPEKMKVVIQWAKGLSKPLIPRTMGFADKKRTGDPPRKGFPDTIIPPGGKRGSFAGVGTREGNFHVQHKWIQNAPDDIVQMHPPGGGTQSVS